ncbi:MAG: adenine phosphoribosyltransferase [Candidatus Caenarcaniphilales bacterium]|jgi:adenine phosphoribosyltransferase|nr:adenine phosphoribosyltransferase [Candidatus Caenarcaniphilales bacterium]
MNLSTNVVDKAKLIKSNIRDIPDFPKPGIIFKDITTLISNPESFKAVIDLFEERFASQKIDFIAVPESRGFIFGAPLCQRIQAGLTLIRKPGKLPAKSIKASYELEYGTDTLAIHEDAFAGVANANVLIIDDLLATGGSCSAAIELVRNAGGNIAGCGFVIELDFLEGRKKIEALGAEVYSIVHY